MDGDGRSFTELSWLEIAHVFAALVGARVIVGYTAEYSCSVEYHYITPGGIRCATGLAKYKSTAEESAEWLVRQVFRYAPDLNFPGVSLPALQFGSKEDLELKLAAAGIDPLFSLTHGSG